MATLRDFVSNKKIKAPNQNGWWYEINFDNEGYAGNQGPELSECFYNLVNHYVWDGEKQIELSMSWDKIHEAPTGYTGYTEFYPIIGAAFDLNHMYPGALMEIGENQWFNVNNNINGKLGLYKLEANAKSTLFNTFSNDFVEYYDNNWSFVTEGFDVVFRASYAPQYDQYWYKVDAYANALNAGLWFTPNQVTGDPRSGYIGLFNVFEANSNIYTEQSPCLKTLSTNIPFIIWDYDYYSAHASDINSAMHSYLTDGDLTRFATYVSNGNAVIANKYIQPTTEGVKSFQCYCDVYEGTFDYSGVSDEEFIEYRYLQVFVKPSLTSPRPRVTLIKEPTRSELRARIKVYGDIEEVRYSTDGGQTWSTSDSPYLMR